MLEGFSRGVFRNLHGRIVNVGLAVFVSGCCEFDK